MKKWFITAACASMLLLPTTSYAFSDVAPGMYYEKPIEWASAQKIVSGYADNTFKPKAQVTFDQFIKMYTNSFPFETNGATSYAEFYDVLAQHDIHFVNKPKYITRGDVAVLFAYAAGALSGDLSHKELSIYYEEAAQYMLDVKLSTGQNEGKSASDIFGVNNQLTRGQAVTFLHRAYEMDLLTLHDAAPPTLQLTQAPEFTEEDRVLRSYKMNDDVTYYVMAHDNPDMNYEVKIVMNNRVVGGYYAVPNTTFFGYEIGTFNEAAVSQQNNYTVTPLIDKMNNNELRAVLYIFNTPDAQQAFNPIAFDDINVLSQLYTDLLNEFRLKQNLQPMIMNEKVTALSQDHTDFMAENNLFSHVGKESLSYFERIHQIGVYVPMENVEAVISETSTNVFDVHTKWISSEVQHRPLLIEHFNQVGFGAAYNENTNYGYYYTATFVHLD